MILQESLDKLKYLNHEDRQNANTDVMQDMRCRVFMVNCNKDILKNKFNIGMNVLNKTFDSHIPLSIQENKINIDT